MFLSVYQHSRYVRWDIGVRLFVICEGVCGTQRVICIQCHLADNCGVGGNSGDNCSQLLLSPDSLLTFFYTNSKRLVSVYLGCSVYLSFVNQYFPYILIVTNTHLINSREYCCQLLKVKYSIKQRSVTEPHTEGAMLNKTWALPSGVGQFWGSSK